MRRSEPPLRVEVVARGARPPLSARRCRLLLRAAARAAPPRRGRRRGAPAVTVLFAGAAALRTLNRRFRGRDHATDVLSFPGGETDPGPRGAAWHLGDVAIGVPVARRQARRRGHSLAREAQILLLHGYLHLLGYDHETDQGQMQRLERRLRRRLGLEDGARRSPS